MILIGEQCKGLQNLLQQQPPPETIAPKGKKPKQAKKKPPITLPTQALTTITPLQRPTTATQAKQEVLPRWKTLLKEAATSLNGTFDVGVQRALDKLRPAITKPPAAERLPKPTTKEGFFELVAGLIPDFARTETPTNDNVGGAINKGRYLVHVASPGVQLNDLITTFEAAARKAKESQVS